MLTSPNMPVAAPVPTATLVSRLHPVAARVSNVFIGTLPEGFQPLYRHTCFFLKAHLFHNPLGDDIALGRTEIDEHLDGVCKLGVRLRVSSLVGEPDGAVEIGALVQLLERVQELGTATKAFCVVCSALHVPAQPRPDLSVVAWSGRLAVLFIVAGAFAVVEDPAGAG